MVGAEFAGQVFEDQFLIADVKMTAAFPTERWFWFDPPFHAGRSALLHKQPDDIWRIDLQLNPDADPVVEKRPENVRPRIARMLGHDKFDFEWISLYKFQCRRMDRFIHGRVIFAGDAAHQVSPFGARGANSGLEDAENIAWKLDRVLRATSPETLLDSYDTERSAAADENIRKSTRSTDFMAPVTSQEARLRKAVLSLARETEFGKRMVNGGRLSVPSVYETPLSTVDCDAWRGGPRPGASMADAPLTVGDEPTFLTEAFIGMECGSRCWSLAMARSRKCRRNWARSILAGMVAWPIPLAWPRRATTRSPARPICCGPTAMSRRASGIRPGRRSTRRWRGRQASTEVCHGAIDRFEFCEA